MVLFSLGAPRRFLYASLVPLTDEQCILRAIRLAERALGETSPNPMVGALLVRGGRVLGQGWHTKCGAPHAEIEALADAARRGHNPKGATLYVTLEPCSTHGRTPPCTEAILKAGIRKVIVGAVDPNPLHQGAGLQILKNQGVQVVTGVCAAECARLNEPWNHWIVNRLPYVTLKSAMSLDGKIATTSGESKWITGPSSRAYAMHLRQRADAILVGVRTVLADDPSLSIRLPGASKILKRIILDPTGRIPPSAKVLRDEFAGSTTVVLKKSAPIPAPDSEATHLRLPHTRNGFDLRKLLVELGSQKITHLLIEGGGEVNARFLQAGLVSKVVFLYAPTIIGGASARKAVAGDGFLSVPKAIKLQDIQWRKLGPDLVMEATPCYSPSSENVYRDH